MTYPVLLLAILLVVVLLWAQPDAASRISTCCSTKKVRGLYELQFLGIPMLSSLAGRGDEGRRLCRYSRSLSLSVEGSFYCDNELYYGSPL
jgi:hypothetical protein